MRKQEREAIELKGIKTRINRRQRQRLSEAQQRRLMAQWKRSGKSRLAFCKSRQVCYQSFLSWQRKLGENEPIGIVEVKCASSIAWPPATGGAVEGIELVAPSGWRIRLGRSFSASAIAEVIQALSSC